jgi:hypothetical protein
MVQTPPFWVPTGMLADRPDGRRLNADEQRQLDDLERRLLHDPPAPPRPVPVGLAATRPARNRWLPAAGLAVVATLLLVAAIVGGPGGVAATASALLATLIVCRLFQIRFRLRLRLRLPGKAR